MKQIVITITEGLPDTPAAAIDVRIACTGGTWNLTYRQAGVLLDPVAELLQMSEEQAANVVSQAAALDGVTGVWRIPIPQAEC